MYCSLEISFTIIRTYVWSSSICCLQYSSPFADSPLQILPSHLPLRKLPSDLSWRVCHRIFFCAFARLHIRTFARSCLVQTSLRSRYLANLRSTLVQSPPQDCCLAISRSTLRQSPLHDQPSTIWRSTLGQRLSHDLPLTLRQVTFDQPVIARLAPDRSALCLSISPTSPTLWALSFHAEHFPLRSR